VFAKGLAAGVLYLRVLPTNLEAVHAELQRVLELMDNGRNMRVQLALIPHANTNESLVGKIQVANLRIKS